MGFFSYLFNRLKYFFFRLFSLNKLYHLSTLKMPTKIKDDEDLDTFLEKIIFKTLRIFFIYQYLLMILIVTIVLCLQKPNMSSSS